MDAFGLIDPADIDNTRKTFFETVPATLKGLPPIENERYRLSLSDLKYNRPVPYSLEEQKKAILGNQSLNWNLRGTWTLTNKATGQPVDTYSGVVAQVPYLTNRGTFIRNGNEYTISRQARLKPGVYARQKANGELESHINPQRGSGRQFRIRFEPATGKLRLNVGQANIPFIPFLRLLGVSNDQLREQFGRALYDANGKEDVRAAAKILDHFAQRKGLRKPTMRPEDYRNLFSHMQLDPAVTARTLGKSPDGEPYSSVTPKLLLRAAHKLVNIQREEEEADDRDSLANQVFFSVHDFLKERINRDAGGIRRNLLWKATNRGNLGHLTSGSLNGYVQSLLDSSFANNLEEINPLEILDQHYRVVRIGEGGISSADAIPEESRNVQPSQVNFIDIIRGPESSKIGTDTRISYGTRRQGQKLVSTFRLPDGGQISLSPDEVVDSIIAFPHEMDDPDKKKVKVLDGGKFRVADRSEVQYIVPNPESMFSVVSNMVPFLSNVEGLRLLMGSKMLLQALPLKEAEAPLVQSAIPDNPDRSFEDLVGRYLGAVHADAPGRVVKMTPNTITIKHQDGTTKRHELYQNLPYNRKTTIHNIPLVSIGDRVDAGTVLAQSNFTDNQGTAALGKNLSVAYMVFGGRNYEDGTVISESAAKKLSSESLYTRELSTDDGVKFSKNGFLSVHPAKFTRDQLSTINENGVVTPGTVVQPGDPLILALGEKRPEGASLLYRSHRVTLPDKSITWNHHDAGLVTDVVPLKKGWKVAIKAYSPMHIGDKMCFSDDTELLTRCGWKKASKIHEKDLLATLNSEGEIQYQTPTEVHSYDHDEDMFYLVGPHIDMLVTLNHRLWVAKSAPRGGKHPHYPVPATFFHDSSLKWLFKQAAKWKGAHFDTLRIGGRDLDTNLVLTFLGYCLALQAEESKDGFFEIDVLGKSAEIIHEIKSLAKLLELGVTGGGDRISILLDEKGKALLCDTLKGYYPLFFHKMNADHINVFLKTLFIGKCGVKEPHRCAFSSRKLADLVQILTMKLGYVTTVTPSFRRHYEDMLPEHECNIYHRPPRIWRQPGGPTPEVTIEKKVHYKGKVYCVTVPNHLVCCRRNGLFHWSHNSGRYGNKGVVTAIVPDDRMPRMADGNPVDVILNPLTVVSRRNPAQLLESALGKIARKTGKPYRVSGFSKGNAIKFVMDELHKHGMSDTEDLYDPIRNARIPNVFRGVSFFMKLHHTTESKESGRAVSGQDEIQYTSDRMPAKGGKTGAKRLSVQDINALLSHGATAVVRDAHLIKARRNDDYWRALRLGYNLPTPGPGFIHDKFMAMLAGSGVNVKKSSGGLNFLALTKKDVDNLTNGDIENPETVDIRNLNPKKGGLFDVNRTGGLDGFGWSTIKLAEPMPNPLLEKPIREMLGLTQENYEQVLGGGLLHKGLRGPKAVVSALESYNVDKNIARAREDIRTGTKSKRDRAVKLLGYLTMFKKSGIKPVDLIWDRVPVLPPAFRPISQLSKKVAITADANGLYRDVFYANKALGELKDSLPDENLVDDRLNLYNSIKAAVGLGDPIGAKSQQQNLKGLLAQVFGKSPKFGLVQRKLISVPQDLVGRATITPDPALDIDEVGLPERVAWEIYAPFIMRRLVRSGAGATDAAIMISKKSPQAREALLKEFEHRPVLINRAPVLHKFGIQAAWPTLTKGGVLRIPPLLTPGFGADFDGDTMQYFVPVSEEARRQAIDFMLPSKNIIDSTRFAPQLAPRHEFLLGLYRASKRKSRKPLRVFRSRQDVISAFRRGEIGINDPVSFPS